MIKKQCKLCKNKFNALGQKYLFCSRSCYYKFRSIHYVGKKSPKYIDGRSKTKNKCELCCKAFYGYWKRRFCSKTCQASYKIQGEKNPRWNGGRFYDKDGYLWVTSKKHPFANKAGYMLEHRLTMERKIGRYLTKKEVVHHKNGIKDDNRPENLELMTKKKHDILTLLVLKINHIFWVDLILLWKHLLHIIPLEKNVMAMY